MRKILWTDIDAAYEGDPAAKSYEEIILAYPVARSDRHLSNGAPPLPTGAAAAAHHDRMGALAAPASTSIPGAKIGSHFFIDHGHRRGGWRNARSVRTSKLYHGVSFIARSLSGRTSIARQKRHPTVEDERRISTPEPRSWAARPSSGPRSTIGGNVFLTQERPASSARLLRRERQRGRSCPKRRTRVHRNNSFKGNRHIRVICRLVYKIEIGCDLPRLQRHYPGLR